jgi:hypothetical protein
MNPELWHRPLLALLSWLPVPLGCVAMILPAWPAAARQIGRPWAAWVFFAVTRVAFAALVFGALRHLSIDLTLFHEPQGRAALAGQLPYRDFVSLYAPGFPYLLGLSLRLSPVWGPLALFIAADLCAFLALARAHGDASPGVSSPAWLYLAFPPVWYFEIRYAQDESLAALFVALALLALACHRSGWSGAALAAGQLVTKPLFGVAALPMLLGTRHRTAWLGYAVPVGLVYLAMTLGALPWWRDLRLEASSFGVGPVLWRLPVLWWHVELGALAWVPEAVLGLGGILWLMGRGADGVTLAAWAWGCHALLAPKLLPMYVVMVTPVLAAWVARRPGRLGWWALYGFAMGTAWYADSGPLQGLLGPTGVALGAFGMMLPVACAGWLLIAVAKDGATEPAAIAPATLPAR